MSLPRNRNRVASEINVVMYDQIALEKSKGDKSNKLLAPAVEVGSLLPNHWHLVLWPLHDGDLGRFMQRLTTTHFRRWHLHRHTVG